MTDDTAQVQIPTALKKLPLAAFADSIDKHL